MNVLLKIIIFISVFSIVLSENNYPEPPDIPEVNAVYDHEEITIYWGRAAEASIDPLSGYSDFEGYRIYRSTDGGNTWGSHWEKIYDYSDNHVGWKPLRQYDIRSLRDSSHCIYSNAYYDDSSPDGEKCYSKSINIAEIEIDSLITILDKQFILIDTIYQEINSNDGVYLRSADFIADLMKFNKSLNQDTLIIDTLYESITTNNISLDSLDKLLKLDELIFEPVNTPCSDNISKNQHDCLCGSDGLWTGSGCIKWNGSEYISISSTGATWDRTSFYIPIITGDIIGKSIKSNLTDSLDRIIVSVPGMKIDTIFQTILTGDINSDSIETLIEIGGMSIDTILHPIVIGGIDADSLENLIGMGADDLKSEVGGYIDSAFVEISIAGCVWQSLDTGGQSWVCDTTATYQEGGQLGDWTGSTDPQDSTGATGKLRKLHSATTGFHDYCNAAGECGLNHLTDNTITIIKKCDWQALPLYAKDSSLPAPLDNNSDGEIDLSTSKVYYPDWKVLPSTSSSIISVPDWKVINNCISVLNAPDFTLKSSGCYAYGADCAIKETCWAFGISSTTCNDPDSNSNIKIKVPSWKIKSSGSIIPVPDWWISENSTSQIRIPQFIRNEAVSGYHELALWTNMGSDELSNKGLFRSFTDRNVLDGIEYTYAVTSYDMGLKSYTVSYVDDLSEPFYDKNNNGEPGKYEYYIDIDENAKCNDIIDGIFIPDTVWSNANPDHIRGINERGYPSFTTPIYHESFTDYNANGTRDVGEPFIDENENNEWDMRNEPKNVISIVPGYKASNREFSQDSVLIKAEAANVGNGNALYRIVNVNDVDTKKIIRFEVNAKLDSNAYGNLSGSFATQVPSIYAWEILNEDNVVPVNKVSITRDEIKENLGGYTESDIQSCNEGWPCLCINNWELGNKRKNNSDGTLLDYNCRKNLNSYCDSDCENECIEDCVSIIQGLPGAIYDESSQEFVLPDYVIDNFILSSIDNPNYESYWTDWLYGVQFRFDNGPNEMPVKINIKNITYRDQMGNPDTTLEKLINIDIAYQSLTPANFSRRPGFIYKIEFGSVSNVEVTAPVSSCEDNNFPLNENGSQINTFLPFKIINVTLDQEVSVSHYDKGSEAGEIEFGLAPNGGCEGACVQAYGNICYWFRCIPATGYKDCFWQSNEVLKLIDTVYTSNGYGPDGLTGINADGVTNNSVDDANPFDAKLFQIRIGIDRFNYANYYGVNTTNVEIFDVSKTYTTDQIVFYQGWLWHAKSDISLNYEPGDWIDDGSGVNINPWQVMYPWEDGSYILVEPYGWFADGDAWTVNLANLDKVDNESKDDLDDISVVPNPFMVFSGFDQNMDDHQLRFTRLPLKCTIEIYTINGELVRKIYHESTFNGNEVWNLKNEAGHEVAPGLYIYVVKTDGAKPKIDKFAIIR